MLNQSWRDLAAANPSSRTVSLPLSLHVHENLGLCRDRELWGLACQTTGSLFGGLWMLFCQKRLVGCAAALVDISTIACILQSHLMIRNT